MKRFFKPIEKDGSTAAKKPCLSPEKCDGDGVEEGKNQREPSKFLTWNANSLLLRVKNDWSEFSKFISDFDPDVIAVQEVRMPAAGGKGKPKNYEELSDDTKALRDEKQILTRALSSPPFGDYRVWWSLAESKYAGTALFVKKCFKPQKVYFNLDKLASKHEPDGRVILAEFETFRLLNTYSPNNGWKEEENSFQRRRKWDKRMVEFLTKTSDKPLIWCGDLNVSHEEIDVSHPEFFASAKLNGYVPPNKDDCGQPGFTPSERGRFGAIMKEGKLVDAYRYLHKEQDMDSGFSWSGNPIGKYRGKRMRIDYFLVSEQLKDRIVSCKMHGRGIELEGFYGSDHCPVTLELSKQSPDTEQKQLSDQLKIENQISPTTGNCTTEREMAAATVTVMGVMTVMRKAEELVKKTMKGNDASHDTWHVWRVRDLALSIAREEGLSSNSDSMQIVELAALLHDIGDYKYISDPSEEKLVENFLNEEGIEETKKRKILTIINGMGFKDELVGLSLCKSLPEFGVVQDADRLDAIGAIGIARCFTFGGSRNRVLHDPEIKPRTELTKEQYIKKEEQTTINHFHEKLLKLKKLMKTEAGRRRAEKRHEFMEEFVKEFYEEWDGRA